MPQDVVIKKSSLSADLGNLIVNIGVLLAAHTRVSEVEILEQVVMERVSVGRHHEIAQVAEDRAVNIIGFPIDTLSTGTQVCGCTDSYLSNVEAVGRALRGVQRPRGI